MMPSWVIGVKVPHVDLHPWTPRAALRMEPVVNKMPYLADVYSLFWDADA